MRKLLALMTFLSLSSVTHASDGSESISAVEVIDQFTTGCIVYFPVQSEFDGWLEKSMAVSLSESQAKKYLRGRPGTAWLISTEHARFVVATVDRDSCVVYSSGVDIKTSKGMLRGFLDFLSTSGARYEVVEDTQSNTAYAVYPKTGNGKFRVSITVTPPEVSPTRVALSATRG